MVTGRLASLIGMPRNLFDDEAKEADVGRAVAIGELVVTTAESDKRGVSFAATMGAGAVSWSDTLRQPPSDGFVARGAPFGMGTADVRGGTF